MSNSPSDQQAETAAHLQRQFEHANLLQQGGRLEEAKAIYGEILAVVPRHPEVLLLLGTTHLQLGESAQAAAPLELAVGRLPAASVVHLRLGAALRGAGDTDRALASFKRATILDPGQADAYLNQSAMLSRFADDSNALEASLRSARQSVAVASADARSWLRQGAALVALGRRRDAIEPLETSRRIDPRDVELYLFLAQARREAEDSQGALRMARIGILLSPTTHEFYPQYAGTTSGAEGRRDFVFFARCATVLRPLDARFWSNLAAECYAVLDQLGARAYAKRALMHDPGDMTAYNNYATSSFMMGDPLGAVRAGSIGCAIDQDLHTLRFIRAEGHLALGQFDQGWRYYRARLQVHGSPPR